MTTTHRADYVRERGIWQATCRACGFRVSDMLRSRAATQFRVHIRAMDAEVAERLIDLTADDPLSALWAPREQVDESPRSARAKTLR